MCSPQFTIKLVAVLSFVVAILRANGCLAQTVTFYGTDAAAPSAIAILTEPDEVFWWGLYRSSGVTLRAIQPPPATYEPDTLQPVYSLVSCAASGASLARDSNGSFNYVTFWSVSDQAVGGAGSSVLLQTGVRKSIFRSGEVYTEPMWYEFWAQTDPTTSTPVAPLVVSFLSLARTEYAYSFVPTEPQRRVRPQSEDIAFGGPGAWTVLGPLSSGTIQLLHSNACGNLIVDSSAAYVLPGSGSLTLDGGDSGRLPSNVSISGNSSHEIRVPVNFASDARFNVNATSSLSFTNDLSGLDSKMLLKAGDGTLQVPSTTVGSLLVVSGNLCMNRGGGVSRVGGVVMGERAADGTVALSREGVVDLGQAGSALIVDYEGVSPCDALHGQSKLPAWIRNGYSSGDWQGPVVVDGVAQPRVTSVAAASAASSSDVLAVGFAESSAIVGGSGGTLMGHQVDGSTVLVRVVLAGDADLNGTVNLSDYAVLASHFGLSGMLWWQGDFNYDEIVNISDFAIYVNNSNKSITQPRSNEVPEAEGAMLLLAVAAAWVDLRRRV
jgi:hypothetical protein